MADSVEKDRQQFIAMAQASKRPGASMCFYVGLKMGPAPDGQRLRSSAASAPGSDLAFPSNKT
jgi:hypothetical protein